MLFSADSCCGAKGRKWSKSSRGHRDRWRSKPPGSVSHLRSLTDAIARAQGREVNRIQRAVGNTIVGQMLPPSVVKGGNAIKLRVGEAASRFTPDLDAAWVR